MNNRFQAATGALLLSLVPATTAAGELLQTVRECIAHSTPTFTFSVADDDTQESFAAFHQLDVADDGNANWDAQSYLAHLAHLPLIKPGELPAKTYVVYRWFPHVYLDDNDEAPAIRVFLRQTPLVNPDGVQTNEAPDGAVVFLPMHNQATDAQTAAGQFVEHLCQLRAKLHGTAAEL